MRIRTIKPAFWANEKMAALPDFARLLAIGLLNYADDHGYFWANPLMIRGALFPFEEDSSKIRRGLAQLAAEGYIKLGKTEDGREVGHVVNFSKHQRVDKPQDSEIKPLAFFEEHSQNDLGLFPDESALEGKGKEGKGKEHTGALPRVFVPPTAEEVTAYSKEIGYPLNGQAWCDSYAQKGWTVGKSKMKDWRAAVRNWKSNGWQPTSPVNGSTQQRIPENLRRIPA